MRRTDILVIGGGIAGLSAAAQFATRADTLVIEREPAPGVHASGRSATFSHFGIGNAVVRGLTKASAPFFADPPAGFADAPLSDRRGALFIADAATLPVLDTLETAMCPFAPDLERLDPTAMRALVPVLRDHIVAGLHDPEGRKLDADLLLQGYARAVRRHGGAILTNTEALRIARTGDRWIIETSGETITATTIVDAAGAWADHVATLAGVTSLSLRPLRRTIIAFAPPSDLDTARWPFLKTAGDDGFYILAEAGSLLASPMDVTPSDPTDAHADDYDVALAAWRVEEATTLTVGRIAHRWAGLRSFVADNVPTAGFAPHAPGFFWLAGQGGYGLQTAPAMAKAAEALLFGLAWPEMLAAQGVHPHHLTPDRLFA